MEAECRRFHSYDFAADQVFQRGLAQRGEEARGSEEGWLLETKIRYYSRFIKPIDLEDYKRWLSSQVTDPEDRSNLAVEEDMTNAFEKLLRQTTNFSEKNEYSTTVETTKSSHKPCIGQQTNMEDAGMHFQISKEIKGKVSYESTESSQKEWPHENKAVSYLAKSPPVITPMKGESCSLSFPQVLQLVQNGQEIPGIQKLNIISTNSMPTISQMARKPKPWESI